MFWGKGKWTMKQLGRQFMINKLEYISGHYSAECAAVKGAIITFLV